MACRRCAAAGVIPATSGRRWLLAVAGWARRYVPFGPVRRALPADLPAGHPESVAAVLPPEQEDLLAAIDDELLPGPVKGDQTVRIRATRTPQTRARRPGRRPGARLAAAATPGSTPGDMRIPAAGTGPPGSLRACPDRAVTGARDAAPVTVPRPGAGGPAPGPFGRLAAQRRCRAGRAGRGCGRGELRRPVPDGLRRPRGWRWWPRWRPRSRTRPRWCSPAWASRWRCTAGGRSGPGCSNVAAVGTSRVHERDRGRAGLAEPGDLGAAAGGLRAGVATR